MSVDMSVDNSSINPYFTVNLDGDEETSTESDNNRHAWRDVKSLLRKSFSGTSRVDTTNNNDEFIIKSDSVDIIAQPASNQSSELDIYNTMGMNLEKKFRFNSIFKPTESTDDITAMIQAADTRNNVCNDPTYKGADDNSLKSMNSEAVNISYPVDKHAEIQLDSSVMSVEYDDGNDDDRSASSTASRSGSRTNSFSSLVDRRKSRGVWTGGESLSTNKLAMMLNDMQGRLNDVDSTTNSGTGTPRDSNGTRLSSGRAPGERRLHESEDLMGMLSMGSSSNFMTQLAAQLQDTSDAAAASVESSRLLSAVNAAEEEEVHVEPNTEVKSIPNSRRGGRITKPSGDSGDESASVTSTLSGSSMGSRLSGRSSLLTASAGSNFKNDQTSLTAANIAKNNASNSAPTSRVTPSAATTASKLKTTAAPAPAPAATSSRLQRSTTPTSLHTASKSASARTPAASTPSQGLTRSTTPSGLSSSRPVPGSTSSVSSRPVSKPTAATGASSSSSSTAGGVRKSLDNMPVGSRSSAAASKPGTTAPRSTTPTAGSARTSTLHAPTASYTAARSTTPTHSPQRSTTPTAGVRSSFGTVPLNRSTTPTNVSRPTTPTAAGSRSSFGVSGGGTTTPRATTPTSVLRPTASTLNRTSTTAAAVELKTPVARKPPLGSATTTPVNTGSRTSKAVPSSGSSVCSVSSRDSNKRSSYPTTPASGSAIKPAASGVSRSSTGSGTAVSRSAPSGGSKPITPASTVASRAQAASSAGHSSTTTPQAKRNTSTLASTTLTNSNTLRNSITKLPPSVASAVAVTPLKNSSVSTPAPTSNAVYKTPPSVLSHTRSSINNNIGSGGGALLKKASSIDVRDGSGSGGGGGGGGGLSLDIDGEVGASSSASTPATNNIYSYHALQQLALQSPHIGSSTALSIVNSAIYMPSLKHSSQTVINAMYSSANASAVSNSANKTSAAPVSTSNSSFSSPERSAPGKKQSSSDFFADNPMQDELPTAAAEVEGRESPSQVTLQLTRKPNSRRPSFSEALSPDGSSSIVSPNGSTPRQSILKTSSSVGLQPRQQSFKADAKLKVTITEPAPHQSDFSSNRPLMNGRTYQSLTEVNNITAALKELSKSTSLANLKDNSSNNVSPNTSTPSVLGTASPARVNSSGSLPSSVHSSPKVRLSLGNTRPTLASVSADDSVEDTVTILSTEDLAAALL